MKNQKDKIDLLVKKSSQILVVSHYDPDPDAIYSTLAVKYYINKKYPDKTCNIYFEGNENEAYESMKDINWVEDLTLYFDDHDLLIFLDGPTITRFTKEKLTDDMKSKLLNKGLLLFDHHPTNNREDKFLEENALFVNTTATASTCDVLFERWFDEALIDNELAKLLLLGILSDTGQFKFVGVYNNNTQSLVNTKKIIELGKIDQLDELLIELNSISENHFEIYKEYVQNTKVIRSKHFPPVTYSYVDKSTETNTYEDIKLAKSFYLTSLVRLIKGSPWGFIITPSVKRNYYSLSFRALPNVVNLNELCTNHFNGGGHPLASGGEFVPKNYVNSSIEEAKKEVLKILEENFYKYKV